MAKTKPNSERLLAEMASLMTDRLIERYKAMASERRRLHDLATLEDSRQADEALYLIETPVDDLAGIASQLDRTLSTERREEFEKVIADSPLGDRHALIQWLLNEAGCPQVAWFIEGAGALRDLLARAFDVNRYDYPGKKSA